ncbi:MAG TPA: 16S rRNA (guanine(966)-N(2))-methyltransferase RsmD [Desulfotomaculum sp.]|nr:16S rRNA (guanine(966)-N(2))-methyltransferase RsmD [Desulfotomaculum sp.]
MRVIAGSAKRRRLRTPPGKSIRPTADRVKEALFNILAVKIAGSRFLDLFAGTGGIGIEALSRGAARVVFVERSPRAVNLIRENLRRTGLSQKSSVFRGDALTALNLLGRRGECFDVIYIDPPYKKGYETKALRLIASRGLLAPGGLAVCESDWRDELPEAVEGLVLTRRERYGDTVLSFYGPEEEKV